MIVTDMKILGQNDIKKNIFHVLTGKKVFAYSANLLARVIFISLDYTSRVDQERAIYKSANNKLNSILTGKCLVRKPSKSFQTNWV